MFCFPPPNAQAIKHCKIQPEDELFTKDLLEQGKKENLQAKKKKKRKHETNKERI